MLDEASPLSKKISFMMPLTVTDHQVPVPFLLYQRGQARRGRALHLDALTLVTTLHALALCHLAVRLAHRRCPPPLPAGPGGAPRTYSEETLLLTGLLRTLWRLSYQDMHDWLKQWPCKPCDSGSLELVTSSLIAYPFWLGDAVIPLLLIAHAPAQHPRPLLLGYRVHTLLCRGSGLPIFFLLSPANVHDASLAQPVLAWAVRLYQTRPRGIRLDAA